MTTQPPGPVAIATVIVMVLVGLFVLANPKQATSTNQQRRLLPRGASGAVNGGHPKLQEWGDRMGSFCPTIKHGAFADEAKELLDYTRRTLYPDNVCSHECHAESLTIPTHTCVSNITGLRGLCSSVALPYDKKNAATVIKRKRTSDATEANIFGINSEQMVTLLDGLGDRDALRCNLALWPYVDRSTAGSITMLVPFSPTAFMNHAYEGSDDTGATVYCGFDEFEYVKKCEQSKPFEIGTQLTYDYYDEFPTDAAWFIDFKGRAGIKVSMNFKGHAWSL